MNAKSIRAFREFSGRLPTPAQTIREQADKLIRYAQAIMARAAELHETADKLEGK